MLHLHNIQSSKIIGSALSLNLLYLKAAYILASHKMWYWLCWKNKVEARQEEISLKLLKFLSSMENKIVIAR
jgi:hypothetical protein